MSEVEPVRPERSRNQHVRDFLTYYSQFPQSPGYAVLLNGPWGAGKTFLIKGMIKELLPEKSQSAYVSLFGVSSVDEIDAALLQAVYPVLSWKSTRLAGKVAKAALKFFNADPELKPSDVLDHSKLELIVFDDLERVEMSINEVLGYLNGFVEHDGKKVVIVANLAPRKLRGIESRGMIVAASLPDGPPVLAGFLENIEPGARLK